MLASAMVLVGLATSCKKERTCVCETKMDGEVVATQEVTSTEKCEDYKMDMSSMGSSASVVCKEK